MKKLLTLSILAFLSSVSAQTVFIPNASTRPGPIIIAPTPGGGNGSITYDEAFTNIVQSLAGGGIASNIVALEFAVDTWYTNTTDYWLKPHVQISLDTAGAVVEMQVRTNLANTTEQYIKRLISTSGGDTTSGDFFVPPGSAWRWAVTVGTASVNNTAPNGNELIYFGSGGSGGAAVDTSTLVLKESGSSTNQYLKTPTINAATLTGNNTVATLIATNLIGNGSGLTNWPSDTFNVMDYGATPDSSSDDTAAIQAAVNAAAAVKGTVMFPFKDGYYNVTGSILITNTVMLKGQSVGNLNSFVSGPGGKPVIRKTGSGDLFYTSSTANINSGRVIDMSLVGETRASTDAAFRFNNDAGAGVYDGWKFQNVNIERFGIGVIGTNFGTCEFIEVQVRNCDIGYYFRTAGIGSPNNNVWIGGGTMGGCRIGYWLNSAMGSFYNTDNSATNRHIVAENFSRINLVGVNIEMITHQGIVGVSLTNSIAHVLGHSRITAPANSYAFELSGASTLNMDYGQAQWDAATANNSIIVWTTDAHAVAGPHLLTPINTRHITVTNVPMTQVMTVPTMNLFQSAQLNATSSDYMKQALISPASSASGYTDWEIIGRATTAGTFFKYSPLAFDQFRTGFRTGGLNFTNDFYLRGMQTNYGQMAITNSANTDPALTVFPQGTTALQMRRPSAGNTWQHNLGGSGDYTLRPAGFDSNFNIQEDTQNYISYTINTGTGTSTQRGHATIGLGITLSNSVVALPPANGITMISSNAHLYTIHNVGGVYTTNLIQAP